jgi:hypothetical protein
LLQPVEHAFDAVAILVSLEVASDWLLAVRLGGGMTGKIPCIKKRRANIVTIVSLVIILGGVTGKLRSAGTAL